MKWNVCMYIFIYVHIYIYSYMFIYIYIYSFLSLFIHFLQLSSWWEVTLICYDLRCCWERRHCLSLEKRWRRPHDRWLKKRPRTLHFCYENEIFCPRDVHDISGSGKSSTSELQNGMGCDIFWMCSLWTIRRFDLSCGPIYQSWRKSCGSNIFRKALVSGFQSRWKDDPNHSFAVYSWQIWNLECHQFIGKSMYIIHKRPVLQSKLSSCQRVKCMSDYVSCAQ